MFKKKQKKLQKNKIPKYSFVENSNWDFSGVKILDGLFKDVVYKYGKVMFDENKHSNEELTTKFEYVILEHPENQGETYLLDNMEEFENCLGDILIQIISHEIANKHITTVQLDNKGDINNESRNTNLKKLTTH